MAEQLRISRQLTETKKELSESEDELTETAEEPTENIRNFALLGDTSGNPWLLSDSKRTGEHIVEERSEGNREYQLSRTFNVKIIA